MNQQITTFREMFPHIKDGGLYMCEDCHTSYWDGREYPDGGLKREGTFIEFAKNFIDEINAIHTQSPHSKKSLPVTYNTLNMGGLHFYDSIVIVEKSLRPFSPFSLKIGEPAL